MVFVLAGCSSAPTEPGRGAVENAASPQSLVGGYPTCSTSESAAKQAVCVYVDNASQRFTASDGSLGVLKLDYVETTYGDNMPHEDYVHTDPAPPDTIGAEQAYYKYYQTHITDDISVNVTYKAESGVYPTTEKVTMYSSDPNTGDNTASCPGGGGTYTACQVTASIPADGDAVVTPFRVTNLPVSIEVQNNLSDPLTQVGSANLSKFALDQTFGTPDSSVPAKKSVYWQGYRAQSPNMDSYPVPVPSPSTSTAAFNSVQLTYKVGGTSSLAGAEVKIYAQVDTYGSPSGSTCTVSTPSSYTNLFCDISQSGSADNPIAISANIHQ